MRVNLPRNCWNKHLGSESGKFDLPLSEITSMSYYLQRVRVAEICREIVDCLPEPSLRLFDMPYDEVLRLDGKFQTFFSELPAFLQPQHAESQWVADMEMKHPQIPLQRIYINAQAHSRRCKLHQPFLIRQSVDSRYATSRAACLDSAFTVVRLRKMMKSGKMAYTSKRQEVGIMVHFMHLSIVVLVMDLCINRDKVTESAQRQQVLDAFSFLEEGTDISPLPGKFLRTLTSFLQKYEVSLSGPDPLHREQTSNTSVAVKDHRYGQEPGDGCLRSAESDFEEFWNSAFNDAAFLDTPQWDLMFSHLDSQAF